MEINTEIIAEQTLGEIKVATSAAKIVAMANKATITSLDDFQKGATLCKYIRDTIKAAEVERKIIVDPIRKVVEGLNARFKTITEPLEGAQKVIDKKMLDYKQSEDKRLAFEAEAERKRLQAIADAEHALKMEAAKKQAEEKFQAHLKELEEQAARLKAEGKSEEAIAIVVEPPMLPIEITPAPIIQIETKTLAPTRGQYGGKASTRKVWKWKVIDFEKLDNHYKITNDMALDVAAISGKHDIAGVDFYQEEKLVVGK